MLALCAVHNVQAGGNFNAVGYPEHRCGAKPSKPTRPEYFKSESELENYNCAVETYNNSTESYFECIQRYVNNAAKDIQKIRRMVTATIDEANK